MISLFNMSYAYRNFKVPLTENRYIATEYKILTSCSMVMLWPRLLFLGLIAFQEEPLTHRAE